MRGIASFGLRTHLWLLLVAAFVAVAGLFAWNYARDRDVRIDASKERLLGDARVLAARHEVLVQRADALLNDIILKPELRAAQDAREYWLSQALGRPTCPMARG